jgi:GNAT superfamily N-acetyltransferase
MSELTAPPQLRSGWEDATPSDDTLTLAALRAIADRAAGWATAAGGRVRREAGLVLADAGSPCLFLNAAVATGPLDRAAVREIAGFFPTGRPFVLVSAVRTPDLRPMGLELMGHPPFLIRPAGGRAPDPAPGVAVREVLDAPGLAVWSRVLAAGFPAPVSPAPPALLGGPTRFWLATVDGEPAATALSHTAHGLVSVEAVATLPDHRGRGLRAAATWAATLAQPELPAVLTDSDGGIGVYRRMGYLPVVRWTMWFRS